MAPNPDGPKLSSWRLARAEFSPAMMLMLVLVAIVLGGCVAVSIMFAAHAMHIGAHAVGMTPGVFLVGGLIGGAAAVAGWVGFLIASAAGARHLVLMAFAVGVPGGLVTGALVRGLNGPGTGYPFAIAGFVVGVATFVGLLLAKRARRRIHLARTELEGESQSPSPSPSPSRVG